MEKAMNDVLLGSMKQQTITLFLMGCSKSRSLCKGWQGHREGWQRLFRGQEACFKHGSLCCDFHDCRNNHCVEAMRPKPFSAALWIYSHSWMLESYLDEVYSLIVLIYQLHYPLSVCANNLTQSSGIYLVQRSVGPGHMILHRIVLSLIRFVCLCLSIVCYSNQGQSLGV